MKSEIYTISGNGLKQTFEFHNFMPTIDITLWGTNLLLEHGSNLEYTPPPPKNQPQIIPPPKQTIFFSRFIEYSGNDCEHFAVLASYGVEYNTQQLIRWDDIIETINHVLHDFTTDANELIHDEEKGEIYLQMEERYLIEFYQLCATRGRHHPPQMFIHNGQTYQDSETPISSQGNSFIMDKPIKIRKPPY